MMSSIWCSMNVNKIIFMLLMFLFYFEILVCGLNLAVIYLEHIEIFCYTAKKYVLLFFSKNIKICIHMIYRVMHEWFFWYI